VYDNNIDDREAEDILTALRAWAIGHPARDQPFMAVMEFAIDDGSPVLVTPLEFLHSVEDKTDIGLSFMRFVVSQSRRYGVPAAEFVYRAVEANKFPPISEQDR
jgi:hypothetical protein